MTTLHFDICVSKNSSSSSLTRKRERRHGHVKGRQNCSCLFTLKQSICFPIWFHLMDHSTKLSRPMFFFSWPPSFNKKARITDRLTEKCMANRNMVSSFHLLVVECFSYRFYLYDDTNWASFSRTGPHTMIKQVFFLLLLLSCVGMSAKLQHKLFNYGYWAQSGPNEQKCIIKVYIGLLFMLCHYSMQYLTIYLY